MVPKGRKKFLHENIGLNLKVENAALVAKVLLRELQQQSYPGKAKIILEAYDRINIEILQLGEVKSYKEEEQSHKLAFEVPLRAKINFRLKIVDPNSFKILGYAENIKEEKYVKSFLDISTDDVNVTNIFRIDFDNLDHPILFLNPNLAICADNLRPIIVEMALKEILNYLLFQINDDEILTDNRWFKFANTLSPYDTDKEKDNDEYGLTWINDVLCKFSEDKQLIKSINKMFKVND